MPHYTSDLPCTTLPGVTRMGFEPMLFSVKGRRLEPLVQRAKLWTLWESNPNDVVANHSTYRRHQSQLGAEEGTRTLNHLLGRQELYQLSYFRNCDYSLGSFVTFYVNGVIKPTNITGVGCPTTISPKRQFFSTIN